jgi:hypothetical protein
MEDEKQGEAQPIFLFRGQKFIDPSVVPEELAR